MIRASWTDMISRSSSSNPGWGSARRTASWFPGIITISISPGTSLRYSENCAVLVVDVDDVQFLVLLGIDADSFDHVAGDEQVFDVLGLRRVEPVREAVPGVLHELLTADVDIGDERRLNVAVGGRGVVRSGHIREIQRVHEQDARTSASVPSTAITRP